MATQGCLLQIWSAGRTILTTYLMFVVSHQRCFLEWPRHFWRRFTLHWDIEFHILPTFDRNVFHCFPVYVWLHWNKRTSRIKEDRSLWLVLVFIIYPHIIFTCNYCWAEPILKMKHEKNKTLTVSRLGNNLLRGLGWVTRTSLVNSPDSELVFLAFLQSTSPATAFRFFHHTRLCPISSMSCLLFDNVSRNWSSSIWIW